MSVAPMGLVEMAAWTVVALAMMGFSVLLLIAVPKTKVAVPPMSGTNVKPVTVDDENVHVAVHADDAEMVNAVVLDGHA